MCSSIPLRLHQHGKARVFTEEQQSFGFFVNSLFPAFWKDSSKINIAELVMQLELLQMNYSHLMTNSFAVLF